MSNTENTIIKDNEYLYKNKYVPYMLKWGRLATLIAMICTLMPMIFMHVFLGAKIDWNYFPVLAITCVSMMIDGVVNFVFTYPILGISGTFMAYVTGDLNNMKIPCALAAQDAAEVKVGTAESGLISAIGIAVSTVVKLVVIFSSLVFFGTFLSNLPDEVMVDLKMSIPAMMGAILAKYCFMKPKAAPLILLVGLLVQILVMVGIIPALLQIIVSVVACILFAYILFKKDIIE